MILRKRLLLDLLFRTESNLIEKTIPEISERLKAPQQNVARMLKRLRKDGIVNSPATLVSHPSCRRKIRNYELTENGKKEAEQHYESIKNYTILVKNRSGNYKKVALGDLSKELGYDNKALSSLISLVSKNVFDVNDIQTLNIVRKEPNILFDELKKNIKQIDEYLHLGKIKNPEIRQMLAIRYELGLNIGMAYQFISNHKMALIYFREVFSSAKRLNDRDSAGIALKEIGNLYDEQDKTSLALQYFKRSIGYFNKTHNRLQLADVFIGMSGVYYKNGSFNKAIDLTKKALTIYIQNGGKDRIANAYANLSSQYYMEGHFRKAVETILESLKLYDELKDYCACASCYTTFGRIRYVMGSYDNALENLHKSLELCKKCGNRHDYGASLSFLADTYLAKDDVENAMKFAKQAVVFSKGLELQAKALAHVTYGKVLTRRKRWKIAAREFEKTLEIADEMKSHIYCTIAHLWYGCMEKDRGDLAGSEKHLRTALKIANTKKFKLHKQQIIRQIRDLQRKKKQL